MKKVFSSAPHLIFLTLLPFLTACQADMQSATPAPPSPPTTISAARLGPTSTPKPVTPTQPPAPPTPTIRPLDPVTDQDWVRGPLDAEFSFLVYCDFQSPPCADFTQAMDELEQLRPGQVNLIYRQFPLLVLNDKAGIAAELALAADAQDAFWPIHDLLYGQQQIWTTYSRDEFISWAENEAINLGLDNEKIGADLRAGVYAEDVEDIFVTGVNSGLPGTPFLLLNGDWFRASPTLTNLEAAIRLELLRADQYKQAPDLDIDRDTLYLARIKLNTGDILIQLFPEAAPALVANFIFLAQQGWYDDTVFHRVVPGRYVEGGDPSATGFGGPGYFLLDEFDPELTFDQPGRVAMASSGPDTNGSLFAITLQSMPEWQGARPIFGQVIEGLELISNLDARVPVEDLLTEPQVRILEIEIEQR